MARFIAVTASIDLSRAHGVECLGHRRRVVGQRRAPAVEYFWPGNLAVVAKTVGKRRPCRRQPSHTFCGHRQLGEVGGYQRPVVENPFLLQQRRYWRTCWPECQVVRSMSSCRLCGPCRSAASSRAPCRRPATRPGSDRDLRAIGDLGRRWWHRRRAPRGTWLWTSVAFSLASRKAWTTRNADGRQACGSCAAVPAHAAEPVGRHQRDQLEGGIHELGDTRRQFVGRELRSGLLAEAEELDDLLGALAEGVFVAARQHRHRAHAEPFQLRAAGRIFEHID